MIKLFDMKNGVVVPSEHCYNLSTLKDLIEEYPEDHTQVFSYLFYMTCPNPEMNPFFNVEERDKEELILSELNPEFSPEDEMIVNAVKFCEKLYETPSLRAYNGIKTMLDKLGKYMQDTPISHGRDGNITAVVNTAAKFDQVRASFKGAYKDLMDEQKSAVRGQQRLAYDQK